MLRDLLRVLRGDLSEAKFGLVLEERNYYKARGDDYREQLAIVESQRDSLTTAILAIDEEIFRISQCSDWSQMRPIFVRIQAGAEGRRKHVSNRIGEREIARIKSEAPAEDVAKLESKRAAESHRIAAILRDTARRLKDDRT